eukprot:4666564-Amphidinium_carterae.1
MQPTINVVQNTLNECDAVSYLKKAWVVLLLMVSPMQHLGHLVSSWLRKILSTAMIKYDILLKPGWQEVLVEYWRPPRFCVFSVNSTC